MGGVAFADVAAPDVAAAPIAPLRDVLAARRASRAMRLARLPPPPHRAPLRHALATIVIATLFLAAVGALVGGLILVRTLALDHWNMSPPPCRTARVTACYWYADGAWHATVIAYGTPETRTMPHGWTPPHAR